MRASLLLLFLASIAVPVAAQTSPPPPPPIWDVQIGASFVGTGGNSDTTTVGGDLGLHRRWPEWILDAQATAVRTTSQDVRTAERYLGAGRAERRLSTLVGLTAGERGERDRLAGMALRSTLDGGLSWALVREASWTLDAVTAVAWNHEHPVVGLDRNDPVGVFQALAKTRMAPNADATARVTLYPNFTDSNAYRSEAEVTAQAAMTNRIALKFDYLFRYSHAPIAGFKKADNTETASIVVRWRSAMPVQ